MSLKKAVAFIPEFKFGSIVSRRVALAQGIHLVSPESKEAVALRVAIEAKGYRIEEGAYLYFEGSLKEDGTLYEVFQGYALALTFFNPKGRATCRAMLELEEGKELDLFIDEYDKFGYEPEDIITLKPTKLEEVRSVYSRVEAQLQSKDFNALRNSLEFFRLFLSEPQIRTRLLYLSICIESVLVEGDNEGLSYKLGIRCANLLNAFYKNTKMDAVYEEIKNGYELRSKIIHGADYQAASARIINRKGGVATELDHVSNFEKLVKDILSVLFSQQDLYELSISGKLGKHIDTKYILDC